MGKIQKSVKRLEEVATAVTSESASEMDEDNIDIISEQSSQNEMDRDSDFEEESIGDPGELDDDDQDGSSPDSAAEEDEFTSKRRKTQFRDFALNVEANVKKSGVVYLSTIPPGMNVSKLREMLSKYGDIGRIYLEPDQKGRPKRKRLTDTVKHGQKYLEGWVEFKKKSAAKQLAACLNNSQVGGKRRSPYYESLWNIKYLNRFKWSHLTERLVHEKATRSHRLRQEVAQAKRQSSFFSQNVEKSEMLNRLQSRKAKEGLDFAPLKKYEVKQRLTDAEIRNQQPREVSVKTKQIPSPSGTSIQNVLASLFPKKS